MTELIVRIDLGRCGRMGPGKLELLQSIDKTGSISAAGRSMGMSYRQAWALVDQLNQAFKEPVVSKQHGGQNGGGAVVTPLGKKIIEHYRAVLEDARRKASPHLAFIESWLQPEPAVAAAKPPMKRGRKARRAAKQTAEA